ncbi:MAG: PilZ domain-containing protein [Proteobacteria bacterium]|nr:PilZ domain-containing protein [Pseudomonadota bacterium]
MMKEKYFLNLNGSSEEISPSGEHRRSIRFPVSLSVKYGEKTPVEYTSFIINMSERGVFIQTENPLQTGAKIVMSFYIPPNVKILANVVGNVQWVNNGDSNLPRGMGISLEVYSIESIQLLEDFLEERKHLVDLKG